MSDFSPKMTPQHLDGIEPGAVGGQVEQNQTASCGAHNGFYFIILMGKGIIPGDINGCLRVVLATWVIRLDLRGKQTEGEVSYGFAPPSP